jgi:hypothetical protein
MMNFATTHFPLNHEGAKLFRHGTKWKAHFRCSALILIGKPCLKFISKLVGIVAAAGADPVAVVRPPFLLAFAEGTVSAVGTAADAGFRGGAVAHHQGNHPDDGHKQ